MAKPWFAETLSGGGMRWAMGSLAEGAFAGFSTTVPNWLKAVGVSSSMGIRMAGEGIEDGMLACPGLGCYHTGCLQLRRAVEAMMRAVGMAARELVTLEGWQAT